jgi:hypothetical protein
MKKIVGVIHPFDVYQTFYVYEDKNQLDIIQTTIDDLPEAILKSANINNVYQIDISGSQQFVKGIINQIKEKEISKYSQNKLIISYV